MVGFVTDDGSGSAAKTFASGGEVTVTYYAIARSRFPMAELPVAQLQPLTPTLGSRSEVWDF